MPVIDLGKVKGDVGPQGPSGADGASIIGPAGPNKITASTQTDAAFSGMFLKGYNGHVVGAQPSISVGENDSNVVTGAGIYEAIHSPWTELKIFDGNNDGSTPLDIHGATSSNPVNLTFSASIRDYKALLITFHANPVSGSDRGALFIPTIGIPANWPVWVGGAAGYVRLVVGVTENNVLNPNILQFQGTSFSTIYVVRVYGYK